MIRILRIAFIATLVFITYSPYLLSEDTYQNGSRYSGMSNSAVALVDVWSISHNQSALAFIDKTTFGIHHENRYSLSQLGLSSLIVVVPYSGATVGAQLNYFGYDKYNETKAGLAVAKKINEKLALGIQVDYFNTFKYGLESINRITFEAGFFAKINDQVSMGLSLFNPLPSQNINEFDQLPTLIRLGVAYKYEDKGYITSEVEKDLINELILKAGVEYNLNEKLQLRSGISTGNTQFSFGMGYSFDLLKIDMAFAMQQVLGLTPFFSVHYSIK